MCLFINVKIMLYFADGNAIVIPNNFILCIWFLGSNTLTWALHYFRIEGSVSGKNPTQVGE